MKTVRSSGAISRLNSPPNLYLTEQQQLIEAARADIETFEVKLGTYVAPLTPLPVSSGRRIMLAEPAPLLNASPPLPAAGQTSFTMDDVVAAVTQASQPCPPQRAAYLVSAYSRNQTGRLDADQMKRLREALQGDSPLHAELRWAWQYIARMSAKEKAPEHVSSPVPSSGSSVLPTGLEAAPLPPVTDRFQTLNVAPPKPPSTGSPEFANKPLHSPAMASKGNVAAHMGPVGGVEAPSILTQKGALPSSAANASLPVSSTSPPSYVAPGLPSSAAAAASPNSEVSPAEQKSRRRRPMAQPEAPFTASEAALEPVGGGTLIDEVRNIVLHRMTRVIDTFHQWDADSSNTISHDENTRAMHTLGIRVSADVDTIWQHFDRDGSGEIAYHELLSVLDPNLAPDNPSLRALDPNNNRQEFHYTKNDAADASKLIERSTAADEPYAHRVATDPGAVDRKFRQGYLRSGVDPNAKHVPREHKVTATISRPMPRQPTRSHNHPPLPHVPASHRWAGRHSMPPHAMAPPADTCTCTCMSMCMHTSRWDVSRGSRWAHPSTLIRSSRTCGRPSSTWPPHASSTSFVRGTSMRACDPRPPSCAAALRGTREHDMTWHGHEYE